MKLSGCFRICVSCKTAALQESAACAKCGFQFRPVPEIMPAAVPEPAPYKVGFGRFLQQVMQSITG